MSYSANLTEQTAVIKVIGVGGGGSNTTDYMVEQNIDGVEFICMNTDKQALEKSKAKTKVQLGDSITRGLGAGANPEVGRQSAEADRDKIRSLLEGTDMVFIIAGMGGGTGTGAAPVVAQIAKELGILTVVVVTKPFSFEGKKRMTIAEEGIKSLSPHADSIIIIPNNKLLNALGKVTLLNAFREANNVSLGAVQGIAELITQPGLINVDFADVRTVMSEMGLAMMGTGIASGENRARAAAEAAISSPLLEEVDLSGAKGILANITAGPSLSISDFEEVGNAIKSFASEDATVVVGTVIDPALDEAGRDGRREQMRVTIVVTGLGKLTDSPVTLSPAINDEEPDYQMLERPTVLRKQASVNGFAKKTEPAISANANNDVDYLDIPAFLRRQEEA